MFKHRINQRSCLILLSIVTFCAILYHYHRNKENVADQRQPISKPLEKVPNTETGCKIPQLALWDPQIQTHFRTSPPIKCDQEDEWVCVKNGEASLCNSTFLEHPNANCTLTFLQRVSDTKVPIDGDTATVTSKNSVKLTADFFRSTCTDYQNEKSIQWRNIQAGVRSNSKIFQRLGWEHVPKDGLQMNVFIWAHDSLSRLTFMRKLPKTYKYLVEELGTLVLKNYNIVGDGTPQALIPILTGQTELELPETRKRMGSKANFVNVYPFVWNEFKADGYVTAFAEDCTGIGAFNYRLKGFDREPTDHYMRTFYQAAEKEYSQHPKLCLRATPRHKVLMNWVRQFFTVYKEKPKFIFTFHGELSHDDYNAVGAADDDLIEMLQHLRSKNYLNNTMLIIMSDHGHRFASFRETQQGKQEERLPFFSFTFPPWFKDVHPHAYSNFKINTERLSTPFDIHPTLKDVLHFTAPRMGNINNRSISLFSKIPKYRNCEDAHIEPHWCTCLNKNTIPNDDVTVMSAASEIVKFINNLTEPHRNMCIKLDLKSVQQAEIYVPTKGLLNFKKNADHDGFKPDLSDKTPISIKTYQLKIVTEPGNGHFETTLQYDVALKVFTLNEHDISRTNAYGTAPACIMDTQQELRPYCYCKIQISPVT